MLFYSVSHGVGVDAFVSKIILYRNHKREQKDVSMRESECSVFNQLRVAVEAAMAWGPAAQWTERDFEALSRRVESASGTRLSVSTLKRLWRSQQATLPQRATLDALSQLAGAKDWGDFRTQSVVSSKKGQPVPWRRLWPVPAVLACGLIAFLLLRSRHAGLEPGLNTVTFSSQKVVSAGVPNTVVFNYDISGTRADSAVIQQSWDRRRRVTVPRTGHTHTSIYYYPGFHKAKLVIGDSIIHRHDVHIITRGWQVLARSQISDLIPQYLETPSTAEKGWLGVSPERMQQGQGPISPHQYYTSYYLVRDFNGLSGDDFRLSARVTNPKNAGGLTGQYMMLIVMNEHARHIVPLSIPGCVANNRVKFSEVNRRGRQHDLSVFGADMDLWNTLSLEVAAQHAEVALNGEKVYSANYTRAVGRIVGLHFLFFGCGGVDDVRLFDSEGRVVYADDFNG